MDQTKEPMQKHKTVVVLGGGPAGVFTACGLADIGLSVTLITRPRPYPAWEGMSERPVTTLRHFGFTQAVAALGPMVTRTAQWNGETQARNREYIVDRQAFDRALLRDAAARGVTVMDGRVDRVGRGDQRWRVFWTQDGVARQIDADFLVEARGREARGGYVKDADKRLTAGPATSALLKSYTVPEEMPMTAVAAFENGWAWHLRDGKGRAILQIFTRSDKGHLPPKAGLPQFFDDLVAQLPEAADWLKDAAPLSDRVSVRTAAAQKSHHTGGDDFLVVGDGAMALDPLSGNGLFYAIGSGLAAVPVINSLLKTPEKRDLALHFYQERLDVAFDGGCAMGREFYALETRWPDNGFWAARRAWPRDAGPSHPDPLSQPARVMEKPVVRDDLIVAQKVIVTADYPRGVWQLDGVPLVALLEQILKDGYDDGKYAAALKVDVDQVIVARKWLAARQIM